MGFTAICPDCKKLVVCPLVTHCKREENSRCPDCAGRFAGDWNAPGTVVTMIDAADLPADVLGESVKELIMSEAYIYTVKPKDDRLYWLKDRVSI